MITSVRNVKLYLNIKDDTQDERIEFLIKQVEEEIENYRNKNFENIIDSDTGENILDLNGEVLKDYPKGSEKVAMNLISLNLRNGESGLKSESLGDYSYSNEDIEKQKKNILKGIKRFVKVL